MKNKGYAKRWGTNEVFYDRRPNGEYEFILTRVTTTFLPIA